MNSNPLMPAGTEQKNQGRARVKLAVFFVIGVHIVVFGALLMQGCKKEDAQSAVDPNAQQPIMDQTSPPPPEVTYTTPPPATVQTTLPPVTHIETTVPPSGDATTYAVQKGDSFYTLGKKFHVSMKAIQDANPGVDSTKLKINQKLNIPAPSATAISAHPAGDVAAAAVASDSYSVKSGDTLGEIAKSHHTSVKAIRALNNLTTDKIKVGQKLKLPAAAAPAPAPEAVPSLPTPPPTAVPSSTPPAR